MAHIHILSMRFTKTARVSAIHFAIKVNTILDKLFKFTTTDKKLNYSSIEIKMDVVIYCSREYVRCESMKKPHPIYNSSTIYTVSACMANTIQYTYTTCILNIIIYRNILN